MSRTLAFSIVATMLSPLCALAQTATEPVAPPSAAPDFIEELPAVRDSEAKQNDDPLERIERRLEQIEKRLERSDSGAVVVEQESTTQPEAIAAGENWRYRNYNGVWWYQLPSNRWVYWSNGQWVDFVPTTQPPPSVYQPNEPAYNYVPSYSGYGYVPSYGGYDSYPRYHTSYGYPRYGGYYGNGWVGLGLSIADALSDDHHHGHYYGHGHRHYRHGRHDDDDDDDD